MSTSKIAADDTPLPRSSVRRLSFSARQMAQRSVTSARWSMQRRVSGMAALMARAATPTSASIGTATAWKRPRAEGSESIWMMGL